MMIEGNGCTVVGVLDTARPARLLSANTSSAFALSIYNMSVEQLGDRQQEGGAMILRGLGSLSIRDVSFESTVAAAGGALYIDNCGNVVLERCSFTDTSALSDGGAVFVDESNVDMIVSGCSFVSTSARQNGGAMYVSRYNDRLSVSHCSFLDASAVADGGAIFAYQYNENMTLSGCSFTDSFAGFIGGAVVVYEANDGISVLNCNFTHVSAGVAGGAIGVYENNDDMVVTNCSFMHTSAGALAGAIGLYHRNSNMIISNCSFAYTTASFAAGAIGVYENNDDMVVTNCSFMHTSSAAFAGAIGLNDRNTNMIISRCSFMDSSSAVGGSIFLASENAMSINGCVFVNVSAILFGGAISIWMGNFDIRVSQCSFQNASAGLVGGVLASYEWNYPLTVTSCSFSNAYVGIFGGAIVLFKDHPFFSLKNCSFRDTSASMYGGSIVVYQGVFEATISQCSFHRTISGLDGGAIYVYQRNRRFTVSNCSFDDAIAGSSGGAIYFRDGNIDALIKGCLFDSNAAQVNGGAIAAVSSNNKISIVDSMFIDNKAGSSGGAIDLAFSNTGCIINGSVFMTNEAPLGGGINLGSYHTDFLLEGSIIEGGTANFGGGMYLAAPNDKVTFRDSALSSNTASEEGGALYSLADALSIDTCNVTNNRVSSAVGLYGGVSLNGALSVDILNSRFEDNVASSGGAIGVVDCRNIVVHRSLFWNNTADGLNGGAILGHLSSFNISDTYFVNNNAAWSGGALHIVGADSFVLSKCTFRDSRANAGDGAAVLLSAVGEADVSLNAFIGNRAPNGGGTVYWVAATMIEPPGLLTWNNFTSSNSALYGSYVATEVTQLSLDHNNVYNVTDYEESVVNVVVYANDYYSQIVASLSETLISAVVPSSISCFGESGFVRGGIFEGFLDGVATFDSLEVYCAPGYSMPVTLETTVNGELFQSSFELWFRACVSGEYYGENVCIQCEQGTFSVTDPSSVASLSELQREEVCEECPPGASVCFGNTLELEDDYWRISDEATTPLRCPYRGSCQGGIGTGDELCADGYEGPVCGVCADEYAFRQSTQQCEPCSDSAGMDAATILTVSLVGLCAVFALCVYCQPDVRRQVKSLDDLIEFMFISLRVIKHTSATVKEDITKLRNRISIRLKTCVMLWQIISLLPYTLDLAFPSTYDSIAYLLNVFNLGISVSSLVNCSSGASLDAIDSLILATVSPIVVVTLMWLVQTVHVSYSRGKDAVALSAISARYFGLFIVFMYLILPSVSLTIFQTFNCRDVDPDDVNSGSDIYMSADFNVSCRSDKYRFGFVWAIVSILIYPVGVPLYYFYLLYSARGDIQSRDGAGCSAEMTVAREMRLRPIRLLFDLYTPDMWYWEVVETAHRLMLTGVLVVIARGSGAQIVVGAVMSLVFLKICDICRPYAHVEMQTLREICQWQIFALFFLALLLKADFNSVDSTALAVMLVLAVLANVVLDLIRLLWVNVAAMNRVPVLDFKVAAISGTFVNPLSNEKDMATTTEMTSYN